MLEGLGLRGRSPSGASRVPADPVPCGAWSGHISDLRELLGLGLRTSPLKKPAKNADETIGYTATWPNRKGRGLQSLSSQCESERRLQTSPCGNAVQAYQQYAHAQERGFRAPRVHFRLFGAGDALRADVPEIVSPPLFHKRSIPDSHPGGILK